MQKLPIGEAAEILGISKEAVYNRIRRGSLKSVEKDGMKFVIIPNENESKGEKRPKKIESKQQNDSEFVKFLLAELKELKEINLNLQADKERLFKEKESMLVQSKSEILQIYKDRDEKLMAFLNAMQKPLLPYNKNEQDNEILDVHVEDEKEHKFISIVEYLNELNVDGIMKKKIEKRILKNINKSKFIKFKNGVILVKKDKKLKHIIGDL